jgi:hypothetical protein
VVAMKIMDSEILVRKTAEFNLEGVPQELLDALKKQFPHVDFHQIEVLTSNCGCNGGRCYCPSC